MGSREALTVWKQPQFIDVYVSTLPIPSPINIMKRSRRVLLYLLYKNNMVHEYYEIEVFSLAQIKI